MEIFIMHDYLAAKLASMIGGLLGGGAILTFIRPQTIGEAFIRGGISVGSAIVFAVPLLQIFNFSDSWHSQLSAGFVVGFLSYGTLGMIANFLIKYQNKDIMEAIKSIKK